MSRDYTYLTWREKTWWERTQHVIAFCIALVITIVLFGVGIWFLGASIDGITQHKVEHERCLKNATNGYEIRQCR